jgi:hypothetical protein
MSPPDEILEECLSGARPHLRSLSRQTFELIDASEDIVSPAASWLPLREPGSVPRRNCLTSRIIVEIGHLGALLSRLLARAR